MTQKEAPNFELRGSQVDALLFVPKTNNMAVLRSELAQRFDAAPDFFSHDAVAIDVRRLPEGEQLALHDVTTLLSEFRMRPIGVVASANQLEWVEPSGLVILENRERRSNKPVDTTPSAESVTQAVETNDVVSMTKIDVAPQVAQSVETMRLDKPLRSGQRVYAPGDLLVLEVISHGAEVIAEGNIYIYAPLRGRALAGVRGNQNARIFCTCLEPELISIAGMYRTTDNPLPTDVMGKPAQVRLVDEKLVIEPLRLK